VDGIEKYISYPGRNVEDAEIREERRKKMTNKEKFKQFLRKSGRAWCDDCLSIKAEIVNRRQVNQIALKLKKDGVIFRDIGLCSGCRSEKKLVNSLNP
jgi:hypothetical protein